jgi:hypothetical protein
MASLDSINQCKPTHAVVYTKDVKFVKPSLVGQHVRSKRQAIEFFSESSQRRLLTLTRNEGHRIKSQFCLTYHHNSPSDGAVIKQHLNSFLTLVREAFPDIVYIWVLEFQQRGVPHFHFFSSMCPSNKKFRLFCAEHWNSITDESIEHLYFHEHPSNFVPWVMVSGKYLVKEYLAKCYQKEVPEHFHNVGRFWGNSRSMKLEKFVVVPGDCCSVESFNRACRIVSKRREKYLKKYCKKNYRSRAISYTLPHFTDIFIQLLQYFDKEENYYESLSMS